MHTTMPTNQRVKGLVVQATEFKQDCDNCSGQSESWSELNFDTFVRMFVEECVSVIEQNCQVDDQRQDNVESLKMAVRAHFGIP